MKFKFLLMLVLVMGVGAGCATTKDAGLETAVPTPTPVAPAAATPVVTAPPVVDAYAGWKTITPGGVISLKIPAHCHDSGAAGSTYVICPTPENEQPTPDMWISTDGSTVTIRRWENLDWEYRDKVIESLRVLVPLTHTVTVTINK